MVIGYYAPKKLSFDALLYMNQAYQNARYNGVLQGLRYLLTGSLIFAFATFSGWRWGRFTCVRRRTWLLWFVSSRIFSSLLRPSDVPEIKFVALSTLSLLNEVLRAALPISKPVPTTVYNESEKRVKHTSIRNAPSDVRFT